MAIIALMIFVPACSGSEASSPSLPSGELVSATANLDWELGQIGLPLDRYVSSNAEIPTLLAAQVIEFSRCAGDDGAPSPAAMAYALSMLQRPFFETAPNALFGVWDAPFVAAHGRAVGSAGFFPMDKGTTASQDKKNACFQNDAVTGLYPVQISTFYSGDNSMQSGIEFISSFRHAAYDLTLHTEEYTLMLTEYGTCLAEQGYSPVMNRNGLPDGLMVDLAPEWSAEQILQAEIAGAACLDRFATTQRLGDIQATYEATFIAEHEAELLTIREQVELRLERAHQVLREAGLE
jgi:hypothetical protein